MSMVGYFVVIRGGRAQAHADPHGCLTWKRSFDNPETAAAEKTEDAVETHEPLRHDPEGGGWLLDFDERVAIVFGGTEDPDNLYMVSDDDDYLDEAEVRAYWQRFFADVAPGWPGWLLRFDDRGVAAFGDHMQRRGITSVVCRKRRPDPNPWIVEHRPAGRA